MPDQPWSETIEIPTKVTFTGSPACFHLEREIVGETGSSLSRTGASLAPPLAVLLQLLRRGIFLCEARRALQLIEEHRHRRIGPMRRAGISNRGVRLETQPLLHLDDEARLADAGFPLSTGRPGQRRGGLWPSIARAVRFPLRPTRSSIPSRRSASNCGMPAILSTTRHAGTCSWPSSTTTGSNSLQWKKRPMRSRVLAAMTTLSAGATFCIDSARYSASPTTTGSLVRAE